MRSYPPVYQSAPLPSISIAASWPASCVESAREPACDKSVSPTPRGGAGPQHVGQLAADLLAGAHRQRTDSTLRRLTLWPCRERPRGRGSWVGFAATFILPATRFVVALRVASPARTDQWREESLTSHRCRATIGARISTYVRRRSNSCSCCRHARHSFLKRTPLRSG